MFNSSEIVVIVLLVVWNWMKFFIYLMGWFSDPFLFVCVFLIVSMVNLTTTGIFASYFSLRLNFPHSQRFCCPCGYSVIY